MDIIFAQIKQITNSYLTKNINTNDRIIDSAIVLILLALFDLFIHYIKNDLFEFYPFDKNIYGKDPWDFAITNNNFDIIGNMDKYKFFVSLDGGSDKTILTKNLVEFGGDTDKSDRTYRYIKIIKLWIIKYTNFKTPVNNSGITYFGIHKDKLDFMDDLNNRPIFMPLWYYKNKNKYEYIYIFIFKWNIF